MDIVSIRGATTILFNTEESIINGTKELLLEIERANKIDKNNVINIFFTSTNDLDKAYPAKAARLIGYTSIGLMCFQEMYVEASLRKCIRVNILYKSNIAQSDVKHIYLNAAKELRPDL